MTAGMVTKGGTMTLSTALHSQVSSSLRAAMKALASAGPMFIFQLAAIMGVRDIIKVCLLCRREGSAIGASSQAISIALPALRKEGMSSSAVGWEPDDGEYSCHPSFIRLV